MKDKNSFYFELPWEIYKNWAESKYDRRKALDIKKTEFKYITVFGRIDNDLIFFSLKLDMHFIEQAKRNLENDM